MTATDEPNGPASLAAVARSGTRWTIVQFGGARLVTFVVFLILARLLTPVDFGLVAMALVFVELLQLLVEGGFAQALIQRPELERGHLDTVFWTSLVTGIGLAGALAALAGPIARLYDQPMLTRILPVLGIGLVLAALGATQTAQLRRELRFRPLGMRALVSNLVAGLIGVLVALRGGGVWALVWQYLALNGMQSLLLWTSTGWRPGLEASRRHFTDIFRFSRHTLGIQFLEFANRRSDDLLVGILLGPIALGLYSVAYRLLSSLLDVLTSVLVGVGYPIFARLQDDPARLRAGYVRVMRVGAALAFPSFLFLALAADEIISVVFGGQWLPATRIMAVLTLAGAVQVLVAVTDSCLTAIGRPELVFRIRALGTALQVAAFVAAAPFGILWVAVALVLRVYLLAPLPVWCLIKAGVIDLRGLLRGLVPPFLCTALTLAAVAGARLGTLQVLGPGARLSVMALTAATIFVGSLAVLDRALLRELTSSLPVRHRRVRPEGID
jgi:PST family polysaccharide transporter